MPGTKHSQRHIFNTTACNRNLAIAILREENLTNFTLEILAPPATMTIEEEYQLSVENPQ